MYHKKIAGILSVLLKPVLRTTETKTVSPGIHIRHQPVSPDALDVVSQQDLQVADRRFFQVIATRIAVETVASLSIHADNMTGLVQKRMHRRISPNEHGPAHYTGFGISPETTCNACPVGLDYEVKTVAPK